MTPVLIVALVSAWLVLSATVCVAVCVMSSRFTAREERRAQVNPRPARTWGTPYPGESGSSPEHAKSL
jgi:hypothetical protein